MKLRGLWVVMLAMMVGNPAWAGSAKSVYEDYLSGQKKMEQEMDPVKIVQVMEGHGMTAGITVYKKGRKTRMETEVTQSSDPMMGKPGQKTIMIDDGDTMWAFSPMAGAMSMPSDASEDEGLEPLEVVDEGRESVSGMDCQKLSVRYPEDVRTLWIATRDGVLVKEEDREQQITTVYSDFRTVSGVRIAHRIETFENGQRLETIRITAFQPKASISDSLFDPKGVKGYKPATGNGLTGGPALDSQEDMDMMNMIMEIQKLYQNGETEKAQALEKKMQEMVK